MRLLLDTHIALWAVTDQALLPKSARHLIADDANILAVSAASIWEIAIKYAQKRKGAGAIPMPPGEAIAFFKEAGFDLLAISPEHAAAVATLPAIHGDPFDRLLIAQALLEPMRLLTHDAQVARYSDTVIHV